MIMTGKRRVNMDDISRMKLGNFLYLTYIVCYTIALERK